MVLAFPDIVVLLLPKRKDGVFVVGLPTFTDTADTDRYRKMGIPGSILLAAVAYSALLLLLLPPLSL